MFLAYPFLAVLSLLFAGLTMVLAPILAVFARPDGNLPGAMRLFQTFDATLDAGWRDGYFGTWKTDGIVPTGWHLWWLRTRWLWRNPGYTFDSLILGCAFDPSQWRVVSYSDAGNRVTFIAFGPAGRFNVYLQRGSWYVKLGWKAWNNWAGTGWKTSVGSWTTLPLCCTLSRRE